MKAAPPTDARLHPPRAASVVCNFCDEAALGARSVMGFAPDRTGVAFEVAGIALDQVGFAACPDHWQAYRNHTYEQLDALATVVEVARALES